MSLPQRFVVLLGAVSALLPLSAWLLITGIGDGSILALLGGGALAAAGLFGLLALGRAVVVVERHRTSRR